MTDGVPGAKVGPAPPYRGDVLSTLRQPRYLGLIAASLVGAALCGLAGSWQYDRWQRKHTANADLKASIAAPAVPVGTLLATDHGVDPARRMRSVTAHGRYLPGAQLYVRQRQVDSSVGFLVLTPLRTDAGPVLLVVRGWVPAGGSATQTPTVPDPVAGPVTLTARVYPSEPGNLGTGLPAGQLQQINATELGRDLDTPVLQGYAVLVDQQPPATGVTVLPPPDTSNPAGGAEEWQHLAYVAQWFILAAMLVGAPFLLARLEVADPERGTSRAGRPERPSRDRYGRRPSVAARLSHPDP